MLTIFYLSWAAVKRIEKFFFYNPGFSPKTSRATIFILGFLLNFPALQTPLVEMNQLLQKYFGFDPATTTIRTEIIAGVSTFLTMAYILAVNPAILGITGMDKGALFATTAITSGIATLIMALYAKMPFGLAPGMGINAFFAYTVCLSMGHTWQFALTAVLLEGLIFILLTVTNIREKIVYSLPPSIQKAIGVGIGLFIAFIGLQNAGISVKNDATLVALGQIFQPSVLLVIVGLISTAVLLVKNIPGALLIGIAITTICGIPFGLTHLDGFVSVPPSVEPIFMKFEWHNIFTVDPKSRTINTS